MIMLPLANVILNNPAARLDVLQCRRSRSLGHLEEPEAPTMFSLLRRNDCFGVQAVRVLSKLRCRTARIDRGDGVISSKGEKGESVLGPSGECNHNSVIRSQRCPG